MRNAKRGVLGQSKVLAVPSTSFPPHTHVNYTQEILRITGNLTEYLQKVKGFKIFENKWGEWNLF